MDRRKLVAGAAVAAVLTVGAASAAIAVQQQPQDTTGTQTTSQEQHPAINGSVPAPAGTETNDATEGSGNDAAEAQQLKGLAKIDQATAEKAALQAVPGTVVKTELDNENGFVVYSVEVKSADGTVTDVKVDAGNGQVLAQESEANDGQEGGTTGK